MADRLRFKFIMTAKVVEVGEIEVDVLDPTDAEEIADKLRNIDFQEYVIYDKEYEDRSWSFQPVVEPEEVPLEIA